MSLADTQASILQALHQSSGQWRLVTGGSINQSFQLITPSFCYFVKINQADLLPMFEAEFAGLHELRQHKVLRVPEPYLTGGNIRHAWLVCEYITLQKGRNTSQAQALLGEGLAHLHQIQQSCFGWYRDNNIGSTPQLNQRNSDWLSFFSEQRLAYQLQCLAGYSWAISLQQKGERLLEILPGFFVDYQPAASLLHGDLWSGNYGVDEAGQPVIFDPAVYYGDRETDMAMTELFGGFSHAFYHAYQHVWPLHGGYQQRKLLYNLYHILNHANLFGCGYARQAERMMDSLLAI